MSVIVKTVFVLSYFSTCESMSDKIIHQKIDISLPASEIIED